MKRKILSVLIALVLMLSFSSVTALPAAAADTWYVHSTAGTDNATQGTGPGDDAFATIQYAIDDTRVGTGDTISVAAGTYVERLTIGKQLTLTGAGATSIVRPATTPGVNPDVQITSAGGDTIIQDFTFDFNDSGERSGNGLWVNAADVEIRDNTIELGKGIGGSGGDAGIGIAAPIGGTVDGLIIDGNIFVAVSVVVNSDNGGLGVWLEGTATSLSPITVSNNTFSGDLYAGVGVATNNVDILSNTMTGSNSTVGEGYGIGVGVAQDNLTLDDITIDGNTITVFGTAIDVLATGTGTSVNATITKNTLSGSGEGVYADGDATLTVNYNSITGNTKGIINDGDVALDAEYNWYGGVAGPQHSTSPYNTEAGVQSNDDITGTGTVDFLPWMIHDTLVSGWNIWSTPIAADASTNTITEALDFWDADSTKVIDAYYFNSATQAWVVPTSLTPLQAVYLNLSASATIDVCVSDSNNAPPAQTMHQGWNLVGPAELYNMQVDNAVSSALYGTGEANLVGYNHIMSPSIHQATWTFLSTDTYAGEDFVPTCGYWVYMVNQGTLGGFTYTPITLLP